jgi:hypothetical protein
MLLFRALVCVSCISQCLHSTTIVWYTLVGEPPGRRPRIGHTRARIDGTRASEPDGLTAPELRRDLNAAEKTELARLYDNGTISQATRQQLQRGLDLQATRLSDEHR